jgi:hypothetical protein
VWDLRQRVCAYVIPAHTGLVSACRYVRCVAGSGACDPGPTGAGAFLVTGGYDKLVKVGRAGIRAS